MDPAAKPTILTTLRPPGDQWACAAVLFNQAAATGVAACEAPWPATGAGRGQRRKSRGSTRVARSAGAKGGGAKKRKTTPSGGEAARQRLNAQLRKELAARRRARPFYDAPRTEAAQRPSPRRQRPRRADEEGPAPA